MKVSECRDRLRAFSIKEEALFNGGRGQAEDGIRDRLVTGVQTCALPIDRKSTRLNSSHQAISYAVFCLELRRVLFRKSTRLNSKHQAISYAVFCLKIIRR